MPAADHIVCTGTAGCPAGERILLLEQNHANLKADVADDRAQWRTGIDDLRKKIDLSQWGLILMLLGTVVNLLVLLTKH